MSNNTAVTQTTNIVPVQGVFAPEPSFALQYFVGPAGTPFYGPENAVFANIATITGTIATTPVGDTDIANKGYVDSVAQGLDVKASCVYSTTADITLSGLAVQAGGDWTSSLTAGDRILVKNQASSQFNGIYVASSTAWSRSADMNTWAEVPSAFTFIESGTTLADTGWVSTANQGGTINVTPMPWSQFSGAGSYLAGTGLTLTGNTFSITNTAVTAAAYGSSSQVATFTVNAQGQLTLAANASISIAGTQITSGTIDSARLSGSYSGITGLGTLGDLTVTNTITGSISGNAATATTATKATNLAGGALGSLPYQSAADTTAFLAAGSNGQVLSLTGGIPAWINASSGTVTSVSGTGTVSGISLSGTVTTTGNLTLGGTLDLSSPPTIGNTTPNTGRFTTGLVGSNANFTDFPNAQFIGSQANTGSAHIYNIGVAGEGVATDVVGGGQWGVGVYGTGATNGATRGIGIVGDGHCSNTTDTAAAIGVRGYATQSHSGGQNIGLYAQATGGASNYALFMASGNIYSAVDQTWAVNDNSTGALSIDSTGKAGILKIVTTDGAEGISTTGYINVAGKIELSGSSGSSGQVLTSNGTSAPTWTTPTAYATVTDDTTTNAVRYPLFADQTTGNLATTLVSSTKYNFNPSSGLLTATGFSGSGASLTSLPAGQLSGTIPSGVLGNSSLYIGTTAIALNRSSSAQSLTGVNIDGSAGSATTAGTATNANNVAITDDTTTASDMYLSWVTSTTGNLPIKVSSTKLKFNPSTGVLTATGGVLGGTF
jgi:hypothetical protein